MSIVTIAATEDPHAERWQQWRLAYTDSSRKTAVRARILFTVILSVLAIVVGLQVLSS